MIVLSIIMNEERETDRQTQTERDRDRERETEKFDKLRIFPGYSIRFKRGLLKAAFAFTSIC